jgi:hydrogenase maturation protease
MRSLVIGYGNTLRSDDGAGIWVAEQLAAKEIPGVDVQTTHQLSVDLLEDFLDYDRIIFVDASESDSPVELHVLKGEVPSAVPSTHHSTPEGLYWLFRELYQKNPVMMVCSIPGTNFEFGTELSPASLAGSSLALDMIASSLITPSTASTELSS